MVLLLLMVASALGLVLVVLSIRRVKNEGFTVTNTSRQHFVRSVEEVQKQIDHDKVLSVEQGTTRTGDIVYNRSGFGRELKCSVQEGVNSLISALERRGYKSLLRNDVVKTVEKKELPPCQTILVYHPELAGRAFELVPHVGLPLCQAVIRQDMSDIVHAEFLDPTQASPLARYPELEEIAFRMKTDLLGVLQEL